MSQETSVSSALLPLDSETADVENELRREYQFHKRMNFRNRLRIYWERMPTVLNADPLSVFKSFDGPRLESQQICNKLTTLYRARESSPGGFHAPSGAVWKEWFRHQDPPKVDYGYYFAKPFHVTQSGPSTIPELLVAHRAICAEAERYMRNDAQKDYTERDAARRLTVPDYASDNYKVFPLCRAIMTVFDEKMDEFYARLQTSGLGEIRKSPCRPEGSTISVRSLDYVAQECTVILVRTGDEDQLSTTVDFSVLEQVHSLERLDVPPHSGIEAVRVSIATAVSFLVDLQKREEMARPDLYHNSVPDRLSNPSLSIRGKQHWNWLQDWHPSSEDEWVEACFQLERWENYEKEHLEDAITRVRKRKSGDQNWNDLLEWEYWIKTWV